MSDFGSKMLQKWGWQQGKGLGKNEDGTKDYIRVKKKHDNSGLGVTKATPADGWWEKLYNSTAKSTKEKATRPEPQPDSSSDDSDAADPPESPAADAADATDAGPPQPESAYAGRFVSNGDYSEQINSSDDEDDSELTRNVDLFAECGGASFGKFTGHFRPEGKFKRIQQQEAKFRASQLQSAPAQPPKTRTHKDDESSHQPTLLPEGDRHGSGNKGSSSSSKKHKKSTTQQQPLEEPQQVSDSDLPQPECETKKRKKAKTDKKEKKADKEAAEENEEQNEGEEKKEKKKRRRRADEQCELAEDADAAAPSTKKRKRKTPSEAPSGAAEDEDRDEVQPQPHASRPKSKSKKHADS
eukprot:TRINITY_DN2949_c0_g1_i1.p2 TRINITY_DN2949_c0_g1~~TRINITY_DN2949_c0_g1_i1.p2  ORF type:complete len:355 (-),score=167.47 TRINITY_DN2949_c0_g1_i1:443-1507(-)